jgi:hypothetical protein
MAFLYKDFANILKLLVTLAGFILLLVTLAGAIVLCYCVCETLSPFSAHSVLI